MNSTLAAENLGGRLCLFMLSGGHGPYWTFFLCLGCLICCHWKPRPSQRGLSKSFLGDMLRLPYYVRFWLLRLALRSRVGLHQPLNPGPYYHQGDIRCFPPPSGIEGACGPIKSGMFHSFLAYTTSKTCWTGEGFSPSLSVDVSNGIWREDIIAAL